MVRANFTPQQASAIMHGTLIARSEATGELPGMPETGIPRIPPTEEINPALAAWERKQAAEQSKTQGEYEASMDRLEQEFIERRQKEGKE